MSRVARVLMLNYEFPPLGGGSGNATLHLLQEMAGDGQLRIDLLTSGRSGRNEPSPILEAVRILRIPIRKRETHFWTTREIVEWSARAVARTHALIRRNDYDLCHCWGGWPAGVIGQIHRRRFPYLVALRGSDVPGYNPRLRRIDPLLLRPVSRSVWSGARVVTCVSEDLKDLARRTAPDVEYTVIRNGVDTERFRPSGAPGALEASGRLRVLFLGRLIERKGVGDLVEAFRTVAGRDPAIVLDIVGSGPEHGRLAARVRAAGLEERVHFHGAAGAEQVPAALRSASIFVMPSVEEAMSNAALEAMASGLPVITTRTGVAEVTDGNGFVVERGKPDQIARAILRYIQEPELRERHGRRSREIAETMSWRNVADAYRQVYDRVLNRVRV